ncbi:hypothetical protein RclHR1_10790009 [Rhizophagus clarus]|uniref:Uncharacterized protein n=1 Tax=Rhizophagus clarus TaxID=94130 RepID=A0A2Z6QH68_9GLOM|nr:hypothetical protein RclHR1_10790009 [Rhizophagus clarus]
MVIPDEVPPLLAALLPRNPRSKYSIYSDSIKWIAASTINIVVGAVSVSAYVNKFVHHSPVPMDVIVENDVNAQNLEADWYFEGPEFRGGLVFQRWIPPRGGPDLCLSGGLLAEFKVIGFPDACRMNFED